MPPLSLGKMSASKNNLDQEYRFYLDQRAELLKKYEGRYVVIMGEKVIGDYATNADAFFETARVHEPGTFLIQLCSSEMEANTQTFHSRVAFN